MATSVKSLPLLHGSIGKGLASIGLLGAATAARWLLDPVFGETHTYTVFYPIVIVAAYFLGPRFAIAVAGLSAVLGYSFFTPPALVWKYDFGAMAALSFFALTSGVSIYFIDGMRRALRALAKEQARAEALAQSHASLFGELNERVTNHLQLVAALLQLQARDEPDEPLSQALAEASARTLLISRVHRSVSGDAAETLDFDVFARQLLDATLAARGAARIKITIEREGMQLPLDQATSVAIVLLECINARLQDQSPALMRVKLRGDDREATLEVSEAFDNPAALQPRPLKPVLIAAMVEQLGGQFTFQADANGAVTTLVFPRLLGAVAPLIIAGDQASRTVH